MPPKQIDITDWKRFLVGNTGWEFLIEVLLRSLFTYLLLMFAMRLLGKRMTAQMSLFELSMVVTLAAAAGVGLEVPDRGLLPPIIILIIVITFQRFISQLGLKYRLVERVTAGDEAMLISNGQINLKALRGSVLSREKLFGALRAQEIQHLGQLERVFLESSGDISILPAMHPRPGLSIIPAIDADLHAKSTVPGVYVCGSCGFLDDSQGLPERRCEQCASTDWAEAVTELEDE